MIAPIPRIGHVVWSKNLSHDIGIKLMNSIKFYIFLSFLSQAGNTLGQSFSPQFWRGSYNERGSAHGNSPVTGPWGGSTITTWTREGGGKSVHRSYNGQVTEDVAFVRDEVCKNATWSNGPEYWSEANAFSWGTGERSAFTQANYYSGLDQDNPDAVRVHVFQVWASELTNHNYWPRRYPDPWENAPLRSIPPSQISFMNEVPDENNIVAVSLPDNVTKDATPLVPAIVWYIFGVEPKGNIGLRILRNEMPNPRVTTNAWVGERMNLSVAIVGTILQNVTISNVTWKIEGPIIKNWKGTTTNSIHTPFEVSDLTKTTNTFAWVDEGYNTVSVTATLMGKVLGVTNFFKVNKPKFDVEYKHGNITVDTNGDRPGWYLHYGANSTGNPGVMWTVTNKVVFPSSEFKLVQLVSQLRRVRKVSDNKWYRLDTTNLLDSYSGATDWEYQPWADVMGDSPHQLLDIPAIVTNPGPINWAQIGSRKSNRETEYYTWVMFRPSSSDIFVPLKYRKWGWEAEAVPDGTGWKKVDHFKFQIGSGKMVDTTTFPQWSDSTVGKNFSTTPDENQDPP